MLADTFGRPLRFRITVVQASDITAATGLLEGEQAKSILADKAYGANNLRAPIAAMNPEAVLPSKRDRMAPIPHDEIAYKRRNEIERCVGRLEHFCRFTGGSAPIARAGWSAAVAVGASAWTAWPRAPAASAWTCQDGGGLCGAGAALDAGDAVG